MKHWLGVLCVAAVFAVIGFATQPETGDTDTTAQSIHDGALALAAVIGIIGLAGLASTLMKADRN